MTAVSRSQLSTFLQIRFILIHRFLKINSKIFKIKFEDLKKKIVQRLKSKDDNIHESEALKRKDKQTLTLVECQNSINRILMYKSKQNCKKIGCKTS